MSASSLLIYPDPRLRLVAAPVTAFDEALRDSARVLEAVMLAVSALGLTLPHIGRAQRLVLLRMEPGEPVTAYVNPEIVWASPERGPQQEGSVSMLGVMDVVDRAVRVRVRYRDLDGAEHAEEAEGFRAACLQHEIDQLDGIFWIERLSRLRRDRAIKRFGKLRRPGA
ncbi:peptide deformylase [Methylobacterium sp. Leaf125]|uniref:peptide deformylase n=1 Tax=Methylobacterium sp. Leaf125 TaxID=1736265 RepID=UPI0006F1DC7A|nr:peptide deformylase [Methylobacterium sp. Leaf125]KQQ40891.1 peptide deformylase [Methylobacterium sp. Leaf125]